MVKYFFKRAAMLMALAAVVIASGCNPNVNTGTTTVAVTGIALDKRVLPLKVGESKKLVATVMPANATNKQVTWASDKPTVAAVSQDGTVTAKEEGTAQITIKTVNGGKTARCTITVTAKDPKTFKEKLHKVTFDAKGGLPVPPAQDVRYKEKASAPTEQPIKEGYTLEGWFNTDGNEKWNFSVDTVTSDTQLYAKWKAKKHPVHFSVDGGNGTLNAKLDDKPFTTGEDIDFNKRIVFTAEPAEGFAVEQWTLNGTEVSVSDISTIYEYSVTAETNITVRFIKKEAGLIVLANGMFKRMDNYTTIDSNNPPVAVIAGKLNGKTLGMALHINKQGLAWAKKHSTGHTKKFEGIICTPKYRDPFIFTGDTDGSDNWEYIRQQDPEGTKAAVVAENYPAFYWVNTYNTTYAAQLGGKIFAWYIPSIAELCEVYKNKDWINARLKAIHDMSGGSTYADEFLETGYNKHNYWSSSQNSYNQYIAWQVEISATSWDPDHHGGKFDTNWVCCIAVF